MRGKVPGNRGSGMQGKGPGEGLEKRGWPLQGKGLGEGGGGSIAGERAGKRGRQRCRGKGRRKADQ